MGKNRGNQEGGTVGWCLKITLKTNRDKLRLISDLHHEITIVVVASGGKEAAENKEEKRDPQGSFRFLVGLYRLKRSIQLEMSNLNEEIVFMF